MCPRGRSLTGTGGSEVALASRLLYPLAPMSARARRRVIASRWVVPFLWLLGPGHLLAQQAEPASPGTGLALTLEEALAIALEQNLFLEFEELATAIARFDAQGSWGAFDPLFSVSGRATDEEVQGTGGLSGGVVVENSTLALDSSLSFPLTTGGRFDLSLLHSNEKTTNQFAAFDVSTTDILTVALTQPLLRGAWKRYATTMQRRAEVDFARQKEREREIRQNLVLDVYNAYWDLSSAREVLLVRVFAVELGRQELEQNRRRLEVGTGTEVDVLQSETNVAQQEEERIQADFTLRQAEDTLRRILFQKPQQGQEDFFSTWDTPIEPLTPLPEVSDVELDWRRSLEFALEHRPVLWQRRYEIDGAEVDLQAAKSARLPQLDLALSSSGIGFDPDPDEALDIAAGWDFPSSSATLTFSVPLRNRTASYAERAARAAVRQARLVYDRTELEVLSEVRAAVRDVRFSAEAVVAADKSGLLARRQLEAEQARQDIGLSTTFQVLEFQRDLAEALSNLAAARAAYAKSLAKLAHAEGRLEASGATVEPVQN